MNFSFKRTSWLKALSGLSINLSAAWFAAAIIVPSFAHRADWLFSLTADLFYGIVYLLFAVILEEKLNKYES